MKNILFACLFVITSMLCAKNTVAQTGSNGANTITTAVSFLTIAPDSKAGGMGDVGAATAPDVNSQHWNMSKYAFSDQQSGVSVSYIPWLRDLADDINLMYLSGYYKLDDMQALSASLRYFSYGDITLTDVSGNPLGAQSPNEFAVDFGYSRKLSDNWSGGVTIRYIRSDLSGGTDESYKAGNAYATDLGFYYQKEIGGRGRNDGMFGAGIVMSNVGSKISWDEGVHDYYLPANLRVGANYMQEIDRYNSFSLSLDLNKLLVPTPQNDSIYSEDGTLQPVSNEADKSVISGVFSSFTDAPGGFKEELQEIQVSLGAEYLYNKQFAIRAGYFWEHENKGNRKYFTAGAGLVMNMVTLDFAYMVPTERNHPLANTLRFSLSFDIGEQQKSRRGSSRRRR